LGAGDVGDVVVLHPRGVPHEPADGVGVGADPLAQLVLCEAADGRRTVLDDALEGVLQQLCWCHAATLGHVTQSGARVNRQALSMRPVRLPPASATMATRVFGATLRGASTTLPPAPSASATAASMSGTRKLGTGPVAWPSAAGVKPISTPPTLK